MNKTDERVERLIAEFRGHTWDGPDCHNKRPGTGWSVVGNGAYSRAIRLAGLPISNFWSDKAPTPSSQSPSEIVSFCYKNFS
jgi:hypothetical protein